MGASGPQVFEFGRYRLDRHRRALTTLAGAPVELTAKAFDALLYFVEHAGVVVERAALIEALWPRTVVEENNLSQTVAALRRALGDGYLVTVRGRGYQFVADVRAGPPAAARSARAGWRTGVVAAAFVLAAGVAVLAHRLRAPDSVPVDVARKLAAATTSLEARAQWLDAMQIRLTQGPGAYSTEAFIADVERALAADPEFAAGYWGRGAAHYVRALDGLKRAVRTLEYDEARAGEARAEFELARRDAARALELDPGLGRAEALAGAIEHVYGNARGAEAHFARATELARDEAEVLAFIAGFALHDGDRARALALLRRVRALNPTDPEVAYYFYLAGDCESATEIVDRALAQAPASAEMHLYVGWCAAIEGRPASAEHELRIAEMLLARDELSASPDLPGVLSGLAYAYRRIGLTADALRVAAQFASAATGSAWVSPLEWTEIHLARGDVERAYETASKVATMPLPPGTSRELEFALNTYADPIFDDERFAALRSRLRSIQAL
jgi:DNA-binding winged helix-turn-helix (wHTH) protein